MLAMSTDLQVLVQFLIENHRRALGTFGPQTFGDFALLRLGGCQFGFFGEIGVGRRDRRRNGRLNRLQLQRLFCEGGCHPANYTTRWLPVPDLSRNDAHYTRVHLA